MKRYLLFLLANVMVLASAAQTAATNTGTLYISGGGDVFYAASDFTNNSGSSLTNNGSLYVKGNLSNSQSSMTAGTGTLYLNGTSAQTLSGSQPFKTYHLNTNNSAGITLNNAIYRSAVPIPSLPGVIATSATPNYLIYESGSSYSGDGDTRHVNGGQENRQHQFHLPVGDGSVERTVALSSLSASSEFNVKYSATTPNSYTHGNTGLGCKRTGILDHQPGFRRYGRGYPQLTKGLFPQLGCFGYSRDWLQRLGLD